MTHTTTKYIEGKIAELDLMLGEAPKGTPKYDRNEWLKSFLRSFARELVEKVGEEIIGGDEYGYINTKGMSMEGESAEQTTENNLRTEQRSRLQTIKEGV